MKQIYFLFITAVSLSNVNAYRSMYDQQPTLLENIGTCVKTPVIIAGAIGMAYATPIAVKLTATGLHAAFTACNTFTKKICHKLGLDSNMVFFLDHYQDLVIDNLHYNSDLVALETSRYAIPLALLWYWLLV
ncbi:MAG: hypothetical protein K2X90_02235 [Candidatus Babeliaceae bacterium]|nr:hypothetical protein [Candidatus Babeliaceae bacterium]